MSRRFDANLQNVFSTTLPVSNYPLTFSVWWRGYQTSSPIGFHCSLVNLGNASQATGDYISLCLSFDGSSNTLDSLDFQVRKASAGIFARALIYVNSTGTFDYNDTWHHFCGTITNSKAASVYWKGVEKNTLTTSITDYSNIGINVLRIGARPSSNATAPARGYLAHPAIWDAALEDSEVLALASGLTPLQVRPQNLKFYTPYFGRNTNDIDIAGKIALTTSGGTASPEEPRIRWPTRERAHYIDWAVNSKESTDEAMILDSMLPTRGRSRIQAEGATLSDALITSRLRGRLSSEGSTVEDALIKSSFRNRASLEGATLADFVLESSFRNRASSESISNVADAILRSARRSRIASEEIIALESALLSIFRNRVSTDSSTLIDQFISTITTSGPTINVFTATETLALIDLAIEQLSLSRVSSDALVAQDALIESTLRRRIISEAATATDATLRRVTRNRILLDAAVIVDASITSAQRNRVSSESASVTDQSLASRQANRTTSDSVAIAEVVARSLSRAIFASDLVTVADATLLMKQVTAQVSEALSISEIIAKSMILSSYFDVRVLLGTLMRSNETVLGSSKDISVSAEEIATLGSSESISLSASDSPKLGSYS